MPLRPTPIATLLSLAFVQVASAEAPSLNTVQVTATRQAMRANEVLADISVIEREEIEQAGSSTLTELLSRQPGIEMTSSGSYGATSSILMRGTSKGHTLVLVDGIRVGSASSGEMAAWSRLPLNQIDRIEILRGPASSLYGSDAIGGVIQIFTRRGNGPIKFNAEVGAGTYDTQTESFGFSGGQDGWHYAANVGHSQTRGFNSTTPRSGGYNRDRDSFSNTNFSGSLGYTFAKGHEAGASYYFSDGDSGYDSSTDKTAIWRNQLAISTLSTYLKNAITQNWTSTLRLGQSVDETRAMKNGALDSLFKTVQRQYTWQHDFKLPVGNALFALERLDQSVTGTGKYPIEERTIDSLLLGWNGQIGGHHLQVNARNDNSSQFGDKTTGAIAYGYQLTQHWRANAGLGTAFKAPSFSDLYYPLTSGRQGNPNLKPESSINQEAAIQYDNGRHRASLTLFQNRVADLISWSGLNTPINIGEAKIQGATLSYEGKIADYDLSASYSHVDPRDRAMHRLLARRAQNYGSASIGKQLGAWEWRLELQAQGQRFDTDANTRKLAGYALTNVYAAYRFERDWSVFARVNNMFDRNYETAADFTTPGLNAFIGVRYAPK
ncbi:TonB-dependent receptor [Dechloromonas sp. ZS-1]|uniref:TonB-dependent receptor domain-containing protein n=1 Tax=Dechloromonas sp. ZS-1 TaxID=3138067 RepID=UPI0031FD3DBC